MANVSILDLSFVRRIARMAQNESRRRTVWHYTSSSAYSMAEPKLTEAFYGWNGDVGMLHALT